MPQEAVENWMTRVAGVLMPLAEQSPTYRTLLRQSVFTHFQRLLILRSLGEITGQILDMGAGTGAMSLDLAWQAGPTAHVTAIDTDAAALAILTTLAGSLDLTVDTFAAQGTALPLPANSQDLTVARYLFQHLAHPDAVLTEMCRVTRPGGRLLIIDIDEGLSLGDPAPSVALRELREALRTLQSRQGGNRLIGRQLYRLLREASLEKIQIMLIPRYRLGLQHGRDSAVEAHQIERLMSERRALIKAGLISSESFDQALEDLKAGFGQDRFEFEGDFIAIGHLPTARPSE